MWKVPTRPVDWPKIADLRPEEVLDAYDGPRLFTVRSTDGQLLLAYLCAQQRGWQRFLLVPVNQTVIEDIVEDRIPLRKALLERGWGWLVERTNDGTVTQPGAVDVKLLPDEALPRVGAHLHSNAGVLLRVKVSGPTLEPGRVPASVVKRTIDGATGSVKTLVSHVLKLRTSIGRPTEQFRRYYDLPAVGFSFGSFEVAFGTPEPAEQMELEERETIQRVQELLSAGLRWAASPELGMLKNTGETAAIIDALAKLTPPQTGPIQSVEVSGLLAGPVAEPFTLTRIATERVSEVRPLFEIFAPSQTEQGYVREFDKDRLTFMLRSSSGETIRHVHFDESQYQDAYLAFTTGRLVTIVTEGGDTLAELSSLTFNSPPPQLPGP